MNPNTTTINRVFLLMIFYLALCTQITYGQEANPNLSSKSTYHNQLFFNRFLINPTFSLVRENKSYINILHRNQYATFDDNSQNYFLGFSNKLNDNTALGMSVYSQWSGVVQEFGFNANYATSVKLGSNSKLTFGTNVTYFNEGLDKNRVVITEEDLEILEARKESKLAIQPGMALSLGNFDFGLYAGNLLQYNQTTNEFLTNLTTKSVKASLQYTHTFMANKGLFADARLMPLLQVGQNEDGSMDYVGSLLLDMPNYGWLQTNFDGDYGLSVGLGFNLSKTMSLGYLLEKDVLEDKADLGWNHEVSLAYTFKNDNDASGLFADSSQDAKIDNIIRNYEEQILRLTAEINKEKNGDKGKGKFDMENVNQQETNSLAYEEEISRLNAEVDKARKKSQNNGKGKSKFDMENITEEDAISLAYEEEMSKLNAEVDKARKKGKTRRKAKKEALNKEDFNSLAYENRLILDELILRQDSIEAARTAASEKRFETIVRVLRNDIKHNLKSYLQDPSSGQHTALAMNTDKPDVPNTLASNETAPEMTERMNSILVSVEKTPVAPKRLNKILVSSETMPAAEKNKVLPETASESVLEAPKSENTVLVSTETKPLTKTGTPNDFSTAGHKDYVKLPIKVLKQSDFDNVNSGYYVIANVYSNKKYLKAFMATLKEKGLNARHFYNKENGLYYVYLADYNYKEDAKTAYVSNLNGKYKDEKWIMQVDNTSTIVDNMFEDE